MLSVNKTRHMLLLCYWDCQSDKGYPIYSGLTKGKRSSMIRLLIKICYSECLSQNHRIIEVGKDLHSHSVQPPA